MIWLLSVWDHWQSALLVWWTWMRSHHTRQKNYGSHTIAHVHNVVCANCYACTYFFQKQTVYIYYIYIYISYMYIYIFKYMGRNVLYIVLIKWDKYPLLIFYQLFHKQKYILKQMNEMITYVLRFVTDKIKIDWKWERQVEINSTREQAPSCF